ncbi:hypothetical protein TNCV_2534571 [Trichonephila clavipes]|nr:hypothetical protein TNCV_2534571 [Trichonephila clavipes]
MPPVCHHEIHHGKGLDVRLSLALALNSIQVTEGDSLGKCQGSPTSHPLPLTSREDLRLDGCLEYPHATKAVYIYKHPCLLRDSNPDPTAQ